MKLLVGFCIIAFFILWVQIIIQHIKVKRHYRNGQKKVKKDRLKLTLILKVKNM